MANKTYTQEEREAVRQKLLHTGLELYSKHGIREVYLADILKIVGISKPFFYKFFCSLAEFVIAVIGFQWEILYVMMDETDQLHSECWQERARTMLLRLIHHREQGLLVMTQEEEVWVRARLSDEQYQNFMESQDMYFRVLLKRWDIPPEKCTSRLLSNMIVSIIVTYNSGLKALPFLYPDELEHTAYAQTESLLLYLESLKSTT